MNFIWEPGSMVQITHYHRCHLEKSVRVSVRDWGGSKNSVIDSVIVNQVGYIKVTEHGTFHANIYGSISDAMPMSFGTLAEAKRYVEDHATAGLVAKKLHVDV